MFNFALLTKQEAINELLSANWLEDACARIGGHDMEDLRQELWVKILSLPDNYFDNIRSMRFFCVRVLMNISADGMRAKKKYTLSELIPQYKHQYTGGTTLHFDFENLPHQPTDMEYEGLFQQKQDALGSLPFYDRVIWNLHERGVSNRELSRYTGICRNDINAVIRRVKEHIKKNVDC